MRRAAWIAGLGLVIILVLWLVSVWVPRDGAVHGWSSRQGALKVPGSGPAFMPRWSYERLPGRKLEVSVHASLRDGVGVTSVVTFDPPPGTWVLVPAANPKAALSQVVSEPVSRFLANLEIGCLVTGATAPASCPVDPEGELRSWLATSLRVPESTLSLSLVPDAEGVRDYLRASLRARLGDLPRHKVMLLGLDGLDWRLVVPWVERGRMPNLERLMRAGTWGEMDTVLPLLSPIIWTTVATGVTPDRHGVLDFVEKDPSTGQLVPITARSRRVPAVWDLVSALGMRVGVVGWWASWPADRINGVMVSDRLYYTLNKGLSEEILRQDPPGMVFPSEREAEMVQLRDRAVTETDWRAIRYFMNVSQDEYERAVEANRGMDDPVDGFRRILAATRTYMGAGLELAGEGMDLLMVYHEGTDTIGHLLAPYMPPPTLEVGAAQAATYVAAVPKYFEIVDRWIGRYMALCPLDEYTWIVVSDHGFKWQQDRPRGLSGTAGATAPLWHTENASFVVAGAGCRARGRVSERGSVYEVAPTIAALLGMPPDASWQRDLLPGVELEPKDGIDYGPLAPPESYRQSGGGAVPVDPEFIAKLEALGYLAPEGGTPTQTTQTSQTSSPSETRPDGASPTATPRPARPTPAPGSASETLPEAATVTRGQLNNLGLVMLSEKRYDEAERMFREAIALSPDYAGPHYNLRRMYMELKRYDDGDRELWIALDKGLRDPKDSLNRAARDYEGLGLFERADAILTEAIRRYPEHEPFWVHLQLIKVRRERCAEAMKLSAETVQRFPESAPAYSFYGVAAICAGDKDVARRVIKRALELNPNQPELRQALAELEADALTGVGP